MAEKAILVTNANVEELNSRFQNEETGVPAAVGYFLVAGFGEDDMVSASTFATLYDKGPELRNGFFEAVRKDIPNG